MFSSSESEHSKQVVGVTDDVVIREGVLKGTETSPLAILPVDTVEAWLEMLSSKAKCMQQTLKPLLDVCALIVVQLNDAGTAIKEQVGVAKALIKTVGAALVADLETAEKMYVALADQAEALEKLIVPLPNDTEAVRRERLKFADAETAQRMIEALYDNFDDAKETEFMLRHAIDAVDATLEEIANSWVNFPKLLLGDVTPEND
ncbi:unnamed protein product [Gongylonema pulchrum]|uniref:Uncharacterized protein n=1 Tax=Gongylonema pulchrum TaxID=637853 RepID=A0A3P7P8T8_9BILA|nr:unnamed protein product [Gongylonema pulchrum]